MLDASGIHIQCSQENNNIRNCECVCVCAFASLLFPLLQTLFACIIKSCNKVVVIVGIFLSILLYSILYHSIFCSAAIDDGVKISLYFMYTHIQFSILYLYPPLVVC